MSGYERNARRSGQAQDINMDTCTSETFGKCRRERLAAFTTVVADDDLGRRRIALLSRTPYAKP
jgi:hypothetical protein